MSVAVVVPVFRNAATLGPLRDRLAAALDGEDWALRLVVDGCPEGSGDVADALGRQDGRVRVTHLPRNVGQHAALAAGLRAEGDAAAWVVMDADLQDPPEAVADLLVRLRARPGVAGVFAGRRGTYTSPLRRVTGRLHRRVLHRLTGLPQDAGAFFALDARLRLAVLELCEAGAAPSVVAAAGVSGLPLASVPVTRCERPDGTSAWTSRARLRQGARTVAWAARRSLRSLPGRSASRPSHPPEPLVP